MQSGDVIADHMLVTKAAADDPKQLVPPLKHSLPNEIEVKLSTLDDGVHEENTCIDVANDKPRKPQSNMKKAPDAPKRFKSAFIFFSAEKHKEIRAQMGDRGIGEKTPIISKLVSKAWRELTPQEKSKWEAMALTDKTRFEVEKTLYEGPWQVPRRRTPKDSRAPKRPMSAFLAFANSRRASTKEQYPNARNGEISRALAAMWKDLPQKERQPFVDEERKKRQEYKVAMSKWKEKDDARKRLVRHRREQKALRLAENMGADSSARHDDYMLVHNSKAGEASDGANELGATKEDDSGEIARGSDPLQSERFPDIVSCNQVDLDKGQQGWVDSFYYPNFFTSAVYPSYPRSNDASHLYGGHGGGAHTFACQAPYASTPGYWAFNETEDSCLPPHPSQPPDLYSGEPPVYNYYECAARHAATTYHPESAVDNGNWRRRPFEGDEHASSSPWTASPNRYASSGLS